ncbi:MAG: NAD(P)/FAD-dependent oxidoreductase [Kineosporiaceae bacterium]|nr:NAD(P)/FAD-dependent oxidoreductase [Kineosporiaceae bacterium]
MVDLLIAGGGPIGLATAIEAATEGMTVRVLEPREAPIDKACGEGLMPSARVALARLGVHPSGREFVGIRYLDADARRSAEARFPEGPGLGVRRTDLSAELTDRALEVGVDLVREAAEVPRSGSDSVTVGAHRARWFVAADGLRSPTREALGLNGFPGPVGSRRFGLRRHYHVSAWTDLVEVYWSRHAEAYVTPVGEDLVGVALLCAPGRRFGDWLADFAGLQTRLDGARPANAVRGAGPLRQSVTRRVSGRTLLVGDAAGYVDALTGEGISVGLRCAHELVRCLLADRPQDYEVAWRRATRSYRVLTGGLLAVTSRPLVRRALVPAAARWPALFSAAVGRLG